MTSPSRRSHTWILTSLRLQRSRAQTTLAAGLRWGRTRTHTRKLFSRTERISVRRRVSNRYCPRSERCSNGLAHGCTNGFHHVLSGGVGVAVAARIPRTSQLALLISNTYHQILLEARGWSSGFSRTYNSEPTDAFFFLETGIPSPHKIHQKHWVYSAWVNNDPVSTQGPSYPNRRLHAPVPLH